MSNFEAKPVYGEEALDYQLKNSKHTRRTLAELIYKSMLGNTDNIMALACGTFAMLIESGIFRDEDVEDLMNTMMETNVQNKIINDCPPQGNS